MYPMYATSQLLSSDEATKTKETVNLRLTENMEGKLKSKVEDQDSDNEQRLPTN